MTTNKLEFPRELEPLLETLKDIALGPTLVGEHDGEDAIFYHYTDEQGLSGILRSGELWATRLSCLKDSGEIDHPPKFCTEMLKHKIDDRPDIKIKQFLQLVLQRIRENADIAHALDVQAATCLSIRKDLKSQWWKYADEGRGYAIGFRSFDLLAVLEMKNKDRNSTTDINWMPLRMVYEDCQKRGILDNILSEVADCEFFRDPCSERVAEALISLFVYIYGVAAEHFKRPRFYKEHELRLTIANHRELAIAGTALPFNTRLAEDRVIEYLPVDLRHPTHGLMPIEEILIGPRATAVFSGCVVKRALKHYSSDVKIRRVKESDLKQD